MTSFQAMKSLVLFDVDATLLRTEGVGMRCMVAAGADVLGPSLRWDGIEPSGGIDPVLLADAARLSGIQLRPGDVEAFRSRYVELLGRELVRCAQNVRAMPGVAQLLSRLRARPDVRLGLLTGNFREAAGLKLRAAGLDPEWFPVGAFACDSDSRSGLLRVALRVHEARYGEQVPAKRVIIVGDTPRDVHAALENGCFAVGVATGKYSVEQLRAAGAHAAVRTLEDSEPLWRLIGTPETQEPAGLPEPG